MSTDRALSYPQRTIILIAVLILSAIFWASLAEIDEITRGDGKVIPATRTQSIQATEAGIVKEIAVQVGQAVHEGDIVIRLDDTISTSDLGESVARSRALMAQIARLELEEDGRFQDEFICPEDLLLNAPSICENESRLLEARRQNYLNRRSVLEQRLSQRENELDEARANIGRLESNLAISERELALIAPLVESRLAAQTDLIKAQRDVSEISGQLNTYKETVERLLGAIEEASLQVRELSLQLQQEALSEKTIALAELSVLEETVRGESSLVARTDIKAPVDGVIKTMEINTIGSFLSPGDLIAEIVPTSQELLVEVHISPRDVAFIRIGQPTLVKISAFDFSIFGGLDGEVVYVGPDSIVDQSTGVAFFEVHVRTSKSYLERNGVQFEISPGLISTVDIITGRKTILHYLLKPINKALDEALTER